MASILIDLMRQIGINKLCIVIKPSDCICKSDRTVLESLIDFCRVFSRISCPSGECLLGVLVHALSIDVVIAGNYK